MKIILSVLTAVGLAIPAFTFQLEPPPDVPKAEKKGDVRKDKRKDQKNDPKKDAKNKKK